MSDMFFSLPLPPLSSHDLDALEDPQAITLDGRVDDLFLLTTHCSDKQAKTDDFPSWLDLDPDDPDADDEEESQLVRSCSSRYRRSSSSSRWSLDARLRHSAHCTGKKRLTSKQKTDIIRLYY
eukprot:759930-Hanusia_phi.AAC.1